jgi:hypothetical protein
MQLSTSTCNGGVRRKEETRGYDPVGPDVTPLSALPAFAFWSSATTFRVEQVHWDRIKPNVLQPDIAS